MDIWPDNWEEMQRARHEEERRTAERQRETIAQVLRARGHAKAALIVAISSYVRVETNNYDGGQYEAAFAVPAAQFDVVDDEMREALTAAARDVITERHFDGVTVGIKLADGEPGWAEELVRELRDLLRPQADDTAEPGVLRALPSAGGTRPDEAVSQ